MINITVILIINKKNNITLILIIKKLIIKSPKNILININYIDTFK